MPQFLSASPLKDLDGSPHPRLAVTVEEGAHMLGVSRASLYKLVMRGQISSFTIGRSRRIAIAAPEEFAHARQSA